MGIFETILLCILIPVGFIAVYVAGKYNLVEKLISMLPKVIGVRAGGDKIEGVDVVYLCDGAGCDAVCGLRSEYCKHTHEISHAINFEEVAPGKWAEKE